MFNIKPKILPEQNIEFNIVCFRMILRAQQIFKSINIKIEIFGIVEFKNKIIFNGKTTPIFLKSTFVGDFFPLLPSPPIDIQNV